MPKESIAIILLIITVIALFLWLYIFLPVRMAEKRWRSPIGWVLIFWIISPFWGIIALLVLGDSKEKMRNDIMNDLNK